MTELFLDGKPAVISQSASFKLTMENFYFTKSSSYTFDVELPLRVPQNHRIFGNIDRIDISKEPRTFSARLVVDNKTLLVGTAKLTSVSESSVKLQLLGDAAAYNYGNKVEGLYIDQMNLGDWYRETWPDGSYLQEHSSEAGKSYTWEHYDTGEVIKDPRLVFNRARLKGPEFGTEEYYFPEFRNIILGLNPDINLGWVAYPVYNPDDDLCFNMQAQRFYKDYQEWEPFYILQQGKIDKSAIENLYKDFRIAISIQPYMWKMAEVIAKATGLTLNRKDNALYTDAFFRKIFIPLSSSSALCNSGLPHWTVNEFWEQIENTFGVVMDIDYEHNSLKLLSRRDYFKNSNKAIIKNVVEEYQCEIDSDSFHDISVSSIGFEDFENNPEDKLDIDIKKFAKYLFFDSEEALANWANAHGNDIYNYKDTLFCCSSGRIFIFSEKAYSENLIEYDNNSKPALIEVDMFRDRIPDDNPEDGSDTQEDEDDIEIKLKIVPASYDMQEAGIYREGYQVTSGLDIFYNTEIPLKSFPVKVLSVPGPTTPSFAESKESDSFRMDIDAIISGDEDVDDLTTDDDSELLYMAVTNPYFKFYKYCFKNGVPGFEGMVEREYTTAYPCATLRERCIIPVIESSMRGKIFMEDTESLSLIPIEGQRNLANSTIKDMTVIHTDVRHCFKFIADSIPDTGAVFNIRNRLFVCEKIEANIKPDGLDKLLTGYFYELKN